MAVKQPSNTVICDICHRDFTLTKDCLEEKTVVLEKDGMDPSEVTITVLTCPNCGKSYTVILDNKETLALVGKLQKVVFKEYKAQSKGNKPHEKLLKKHYDLRRKLSFKRHELAKKFDGSFYQTEDGKEQLDYHYHE